MISLGTFDKEFWSSCNRLENLSHFYLFYDIAGSVGKNPICCWKRTTSSQNNISLPSLSNPHISETVSCFHRNALVHHNKICRSIREEKKIMQSGLSVYLKALKYELYLRKFRRHFNDICICVVYVDQWINFWTQSLISAACIHLYMNMHHSYTLLLLLLLLIIIFCSLP